MTEEEYDETRYEAFQEYKRQLAEGRREVAQMEEAQELLFQHTYGMGENE